MKKDLYKTLGEAKCEELAKKSWGFWTLLELGTTRKNAQVRGVVMEGIAKDFIREFLPTGFRLKSGLIFDSRAKNMSPQIDAIIYSGVPLLDFTDAVVVEKEQVKAIFEIKSWVDQTNLFGHKSAGIRNPNSGLFAELHQRKPFLQTNAISILFTFELHSSSRDKEVITRLREICDRFAVVIRREPLVERKKGKPGRVMDFSNSISGLIEWLRNLK